MTKITKIPVPFEILKGNWHETVYAINTESESIEYHNTIVEESINSIINDFNNNNHYTVSLREVKRETVFANERVGCYCTLVQFEVHDIY